jgi:hypothetical protein
MSDFAKGVNPLKNLWVQTLVHYSDKALSKFDKMVYLYDPSWIGTNSREDTDTLPFAFLEVIKEDIVQNCSVSKKRLILFEPDSTVGKTTQEYRKSAINIVADNVVNEPVLFKIECLVPMDAISRSLVDTVNVFGNMSASAYANSNKDQPLSFIPLGVAESFSRVLAAMNVISNTVSLINKVLSVTKKSNGTGTDYNRRSLLSMARRRALIRYKSWSSWETKTVVITGLTIHKVGTEDDFYRATVELQEMPILYIGRVSSRLGKSSLDNSLSITISKAVKKTFDSTIGKMER